MITCKCGCNIEISGFDKRGRKREYIHGHNKRGIPHSQETKDKIGLKNKNRIYSKEEILRLKIYAKKRKGKPLSLSQRKKIGKALKGRIPWNKGLTGVYTEIWLQKKSESFLGENNPRWNGGNYCNIYDESFKHKFKEKIRNLNNRCCVICKNHEDNFKRRLAIHHIDINKKNTCEENCISLCDACHNKIHMNYLAEKLIPFFKKIVGLRREVIRLV